MKENSQYRIAIPMMGKGVTNHIHRPEIINAFLEQGIELCFFVRPDYFDIIDRYPGCRYLSCSIPVVRENKRHIAGFFEYWRSLYPARDPGRKIRFRELNAARSCFSRVRNNLLAWCAGSRRIMQLALMVEEWLLTQAENIDIDETDFNLVLMMGIGTQGTRPEAAFARWARHHRIPVLQIIANYDGLSSKGFRGTQVDALMVWGEAMQEDAVNLQGIPASRVQKIGALRYDHLQAREHTARDTFWRQRGLDPESKIILFAGGRNEQHYFEMLSAFEELSTYNAGYQLVVRVYPKKSLLRSAAMMYFLRVAGAMPGVYVSIADPSFEKGAEDKEVLVVEEEELWSLIKHCDLLVNLYSTIALEACLFDKPVINMWYFSSIGMTVRQPVYIPYPQIYHIRKFVEYGASCQATDREQLIELIQSEAEHPESRSQQRQLAVKKELGPLDGKVSSRLVEYCVSRMSESD